MIKGLFQALMALFLVLLVGYELSAQEYGSAARVNGAEISQFRLERHFEDYLREQQRSVAQIRNPSVYKRLKREALEQLIDKELLWQEAGRRGITVEDAAIDARISQLRQAFPNREAFIRALATAGFDEASYADYTRHEIASQQVFVQMGRVEPPSDEAVLAFDEERRKAGESQANQSTTTPVEREQGLALSKNLLLERQQAQARQAGLQRLRGEALIERADTR